MWEPCKPPPPIHPRFPSFPLPLKSTARFSKTHPKPNSNTSLHIHPISTFPSTTVTTAGLLSSFLVQNPLPVALCFCPCSRFCSCCCPCICRCLAVALAFLSVIPQRGICFSLKMHQTQPPPHTLHTHTSPSPDFIAANPFFHVHQPSAFAYNQPRPNHAIAGVSGLAPRGVHWHHANSLAYQASRRATRSIFAASRRKNHAFARLRGN